jgi:hypothetical protein
MQSQQVMMVPMQPQQPMMVPMQAMMAAPQPIQQPQQVVIDHLCELTVLLKFVFLATGKFLFSMLLQFHLSKKT